MPPQSSTLTWTGTATPTGSGFVDFAPSPSPSKSTPTWTMGSGLGARLVYIAWVSAQGNTAEQLSLPTWRLHLLEGLLKAAALLMSIALPALIIQTRSYRWDWTAPIVLGYLLVLLGWLRRGLPYRLRAMFLLYALAVVSWLGFVRVGLQVGPSVGSAMVVVVAGLLLGRRALLVAYLLMIGALLGIGALHSWLDARWVAPQARDPALFSNWVRGAFAFALFDGLLAVAVMFVVSRIEGSLNARTVALEELRAEQRQREQAEQALAQANQQIIQMQKLEALGRLSGGVAHDFNNALVVIIGWTDILRSQQDDPRDLKKALDEIGAAAQSAARLTQQLLSFGRKAMHVPEPVSLTELVARFSETLSRLLPDNVRVRTELGETVPPALVDPGQMHQVLVNLCLNARDAMPHGGELTLRVNARHVAEGEALPQGEWVALTVADTGVGMDQHTLENAFEPFFSTKGEHGNGLGLASVYGIVQQSGGHVSVVSKPSEGSTFTLLFPLASVHGTRRPASPSRGIPRRATILVAEDEPAVRRLIVQSLQGLGYSVLEAENGDAALALARRHAGTIDLLCTDGVMPGISSRTLIAGFRALFPAGKVLVCSGHIAEQGLRESVQAGALSFLAKPFTSKQLSAAVADSLAPPALN